MRCAASSKRWSSAKGPEPGNRVSATPTPITSTASIFGTVNASPSSTRPKSRAITLPTERLTVSTKLTQARGRARSCVARARVPRLTAAVSHTGIWKAWRICPTSRRATTTPRTPRVTPAHSTKAWKASEPWRRASLSNGRATDHNTATRSISRLPVSSTRARSRVPRVVAPRRLRLRTKAPTTTSTMPRPCNGPGSSPRRGIAKRVVITGTKDSSGMVTDNGDNITDSMKATLAPTFNSTEPDAGAQ